MLCDPQEGHWPLLVPGSSSISHEQALVVPDRHALIGFLEVVQAQPGGQGEWGGYHSPPSNMVMLRQTQAPRSGHIQLLICNSAHISMSTHTYTRMLKTYRTVGVETLLVIAGWTILPEHCVSHYRLGYPAITINPTQISKLTQPLSLFGTFIVDLGNPPGEQPSSCWLSVPHCICLIASL